MFSIPLSCTTVDDSCSQVDDSQVRATQFGYMYYYGNRVSTYISPKCWLPCLPWFHQKIVCIDCYPNDYGLVGMLLHVSEKTTVLSALEWAAWLGGRGNPSMKHLWSALDMATQVQQQAQLGPETPPSPPVSSTQYTHTHHHLRQIKWHTQTTEVEGSRCDAHRLGS